jgi:hypothetical protein
MHVRRALNQSENGHHLQRRYREIGANACESEWKERTILRNRAGRGLTVVTPFFTLTFLTSFLSPLLPTWMPLLLLMEIVAPSLMLQ